MPQQSPFLSTDPNALDAPSAPGSPFLSTDPTALDAPGSVADMPHTRAYAEARAAALQAEEEARLTALLTPMAPGTTSISGGPAAYATVASSGQVTPAELAVIGASAPVQQSQPPDYRTIFPTVTPPDLEPPMPVHTRGRWTGLPGEDFSSATPEPLTEGLIQAGKGAAVLGRQLTRPQVLPAEPHVMGQGAPGADAAALNAGSDLLEGAMKIGTPVAIAGAIVDLPGAAAVFGLSYLAGVVTGKVADLAQATPEAKRFAQNVASAATALGGAKVVLDRIGAIPDLAQAAARPRILAGLLRVNPPAAGRTSGYGPGEVPGYRPEPTTMDALERTSQRPPSAETLAIEESVRNVPPAERVVTGEVTRPVAEPVAPAPTVRLKPDLVAPAPFVSTDPAAATAVTPPTAPVPRGTEPTPVDRGMLYDEEVRVNDGQTGQWIGVPSTAESQQHAEQLIEGLHDGDTLTDSLGDEWIVNRATSSRGRTEVYVSAPNGKPVGGFAVQRAPGEAWKHNSELRAMVERARITRVESSLEAATPFVSTNPAATAVAPPELSETHETPIAATAPPEVPRATPSGAPSPFVSTDPAAATTITEGSTDAHQRQDQGAPPAGSRREDARTERGAPDEGGPPARGSEGDRAPRGGLPPDAADKTNYDGLTFVRQPAAHAQTRLTPEVRRELARMQEELDTFPFTEATWTDLSHEHGLRGNVAGGHMQKIPASGGAPVYEDILGEAPLATPRKNKEGKPHVARKVSGGRGDVREAIRRVLAASDIHNHLAEGAVRVAERRAAGDYHGLSAPWLPPSWETGTTSDEIPADLDALIDELAAAEGVDPEKSDTLDTADRNTSLNVDEADQSLPITEQRAGVARIREETEAKRAAVATEFASFGNDVGAIQLTNPRGQTIVLSKSTRERGKWQLTYFGEDSTPHGHSNLDTLEQAYASARGIWGTGTYGPSHGDSSYRPTEVHTRDGVIAKFDQKLFDQRTPADTLDTGEQQSRLPEAGAVRDRDVKTPTFEAPFTLSGGADTTPKEREADLFARDLEESRKKDGPQFSRTEEPAAPFYSALTRAAEQLPQAKGLGVQMLAMLTKAKGVKQEEVAWSGVGPWLQAQQSVTRDAIVDYLRANEVRVSETMLGAESPDLLKKRGEEFVLLDEIDRARSRAFGAGTQGNEPGQIPPQVLHNVARWAAEAHGTDAYARQRAKQSLAQLQLSPERETALMEYGRLANESRVLHNEVLGLQRPAKFERHTLVGGTNYRELLLTLPPGPMHESTLEWASAREQLNLQSRGGSVQHATVWTALHGDGEYRITRFERAVAPNIGQIIYAVDSRDIRGPASISNGQFQSLKAAQAAVEAVLQGRSLTQGAVYQRQPFAGGHFHEPNVVAHVRFNDRTDADGKRVLFVEEVQSDWHQRGRKEGYRDTNKAATAIAEWRAALAAYRPLRQDLVGVLENIDQLGFDTMNEAVSAVVSSPDWKDRYDWTGTELPDDMATVAAAVEAHNRLVEANTAATAAEHGMVPDAPFKTTWPELAMKRVVRYAAEHGYDRVAWTTGAQQAARYSLEKQVDEIRYTKLADGTYALTVWKDGRSVDGTEQYGVTLEKLEAVVGKDIAQRIDQNAGTLHEDDGTRARLQKRGRATEAVHEGRSWFLRFEDGSQMGTWLTKADAHADMRRFNDTLANEPERSLTGENLKIGGEGMKRFYDQILPATMNKFGKPFGAHVSTTKLRIVDAADYDLVAAGSRWRIVERSSNEFVGPTFANGADAETWLQEHHDASLDAADEYQTRVHAIDLTPPMRATALQGLPLFKPTLTRKQRDRIHAEARAEQQALERAYSTIPTVRIGDRRVPVYDTGKRLTVNERNLLLQRPEVRRLITVITKATDAVVAALLEEPTGVERTGILLDAAAYGVFFPKPGTPPAGAKQVATILINPFEPMRGDDITPLVAAATVYTTIVHEATHWAVKGHGTDFLQAYDEHLARLADSQVHVHAFQQLWEAYADITRARAFRPGLVEALSSYSTSRGRRGTPGDALGRAAGYEQRPTDDAGGSRDPAREAGRDRSATPRTVSVADLERLAERLGTSVAVQRARAEAAGYTVRGTAPPVAQVSVVPGVDAFVERDITPGFEAAFKAAGEARNGILATWAPGMASPDAETMGAIMRANLALRRQRTGRAQRAMRALEVAWDKQPQAAQRAFAMAVDEGRIEDLPAWQQDLARVLTEINTKKRHEANALGGNVGFVKDYYPREWVQPGKVRAFLLKVIYGKRPLQGRAGFKKARSRDKETGEPFTFRQMIDAGFEPVTDNPITAHLRKWLEMDKWIAARRILLEGKRFGVATFVKIGDEPPAGEIRYPESFGTVYAPPVVPVQEAYDERLMQALHAFAESLGVKTVRRVKVGGTRWGYAVGDAQIVTKFAGPETVLEHEIGHILDERYGLREQWVKNKLMVKELRALADLRFEGTDRTAIPASFLRYVRKGPEKIANLVHAFIYNPELAKKIAPNAYWALYNLAKDTPALHPLLTLQSTKSLVLGTAASEVAVGGLVIKGYYYGPPDAVRLLANHLSPGLRGHALFNLYRRTGNLLNQVQLGLSLFHFVMTSVDQVVGKSGMVLEHLARGQFKDAGIKALMTPVAPLVDVVRGDRLLKQFYAKDADFRTLTGVADAVARGGGGVGWDTFWHESAPERFLQAFRGAVAEAKAGNYPGAALRTATLPWRAVLAAVELQAKPIMEWWVPRLKLAAYWDLYRMELQDLGEKPDEIELRKVAGRAWDSVDNWLGELIYDNLFWHSILKDAGMASVRALGWNLGTVRGAIGAVPRQLRQLGAMPGASAGGGGFGKPPMRLRHTRSEPNPEGGPDIPVYEHGRAPLLVHDFARLVSAFFWVGLFGALYQYLHTGRKPGEDDDGHIDRSKIALDLYFPRTGGFRSDGRPERASIPSYVKEVYAFVKHPIETATHKAHPLGSLTYDILVKNEDYFGTEIHDGDDPWVTQAHDLFSFIADQYQPISVRTFQQRRTQRGDTGIGAVESFFGISPAPQTVTRSDAEEYLHSIAPPTHRTKEQAVQAQGRRDLRAARQAGDPVAAAAAIQQGNLSRRSIQLTAKSARQSSLQRSFQTTTLPQGLKAYELATPEERAELQLPLVQKWHRLFKDVPSGDKVTLAARFTAAMKLPVARHAPAAVAQ